jgi:hypothetical protein
MTKQLRIDCVHAVRVYEPKRIVKSVRVAVERLWIQRLECACVGGHEAAETAGHVSGFEVVEIRFAIAFFAGEQ